jgi:hypothetical protein
MTEAVTITSDELALLCDIVGGWSPRVTDNPNADKQQALHRLIANGICRAGEWTLHHTVPTHRQD